MGGYVHIEMDENCRIYKHHTNISYQAKFQIGTVLQKLLCTECEVTSGPNTRLGVFCSLCCGEGPEMGGEKVF